MPKISERRVQWGKLHPKEQGGKYRDSNRLSILDEQEKQVKVLNERLLRQGCSWFYCLRKIIIIFFFRKSQKRQQIFILSLVHGAEH
jgi:hypothetical protein